MALDVVDLRSFYASPLGHVARRTVGRVMLRLWPDCRRQRLLGLGYATPYLPLLGGEAERVIAFMPAAQGVVNWPSTGRSCAALADPTMMPLPEAAIDRVILPGGESTTQGKLLRSTGLFEPFAAHIKAGKPVLGTCAGMILLAKKLDNDENVYFGALDAVVRRNAYGRQLGSFQAIADFGQADDPQRIADFPLVFIRGPYVVSVGPEATVETEVDGHVVGLRQGNILATAFHPELTDDIRIHELFLSL